MEKVNIIYKMYDSVRVPPEYEIHLSGYRIDAKHVVYNQAEFIVINLISGETNKGIVVDGESEYCPVHIEAENLDGFIDIADDAVVNFMKYLIKVKDSKD
ncbi:hypothetical protein RJD24_14670 [Bacillaceae bacterium IKA-2]|nr:hypothetical protein RJD24_14670 [Bacillaceae bacterium IKA-2]